ncbi:AAA family ATPase [Chitinivorax sp. B]|uniref:chloramphenicol phosphotransferase CPT family protein n=1 Tax=Chitinivorax sp. B TaxID=2502235 RepID=UPI0010F946C8|nr:AAA family ATPase [Chitinivorax sp. B]
MQGSVVSAPSPGKIILLNGASSAGKSTLAKGLQDQLDQPFWHFSIDHLIAANMHPHQRADNAAFSWRMLREPFFSGFHHCLPALARTGNNLIVEHIIETRAWMDRLLQLLDRHDVFFVGVHCNLPELESREQQRGDRRIGEARADFEITHTFGQYDFEIDTSAASLTDNVQTIIAAWHARRQPSAFDRMCQQRSTC